MLATGEVRPLVGAAYPLEAAPDALRSLAERRAVGKVVLRVRHPGAVSS
jgi:NADPH2:quinone reductase